MLKQYTCTQCGNVKVVEESRHRLAPKISCENLRLAEGFDPVECNGELVEYKDNLFPANTEIISMIAELSTKLTMTRIDNENKEIQKNQALNDLAVARDSLKLSQKKSEGLREQIKKITESHGDIVEGYQEKLDLESSKVVALSEKIESSEAETQI